jgi:hypothetical protein
MRDPCNRVTSGTQSQDARPIQKQPWPLAMWGVFLVTLGEVIYLAGVLFGAVHRLLGGKILVVSQGLLWWSGLPVVGGIILSALDLIFFTPKRRGDTEVSFEPVNSPDLTVVLTAFNGELSIAQSVLDFKSHPRVR